MHNEELHKFYASPDILRAIKSRRMKWAGHVASTEEMKYAQNILAGKPGEGETTRKTYS
jgi:hypothetical protein